MNLFYIKNVNYRYTRSKVNYGKTQTNKKIKRMQENHIYNTIFMKDFYEGY